MPLSTDKKAMLNHLAAQGDLMAMSALSLEATGRAGLLLIGTPAAKSANSVKGTFYGDQATNPIAGPFTAPAVPRNLRAVFGADWDGGDLVIVGTNQYGLPVTETLVAVAGTTVVGTKIFKTITSVTKGAVGVGTHATNTATIGTGDKLGMTMGSVDTVAIGFVDGVAEEATMDMALDAVTFTSAPNGAKVFKLLMNF